MRPLILIATVIWLAATAGCATSPAVSQVIALPGCGRAVLTQDWVGSAGLLEIRATQCTSASSGKLLPEAEADDFLGSAAWRTPGRTVGYVEVVLDHMADRPADPYPRTLVLTADDAQQKWGTRAVAPRADTPQHVRNIVNGLLLVLVLSIVAIVVTATMVFLSLGVCRGNIVVVWRL